MSICLGYKPSDEWKTEVEDTTRLLALMVAAYKSRNSDEIRKSVLGHAREAIAGVEPDDFFRIPIGHPTRYGPFWVSDTNVPTPGHFHRVLDDSPINPSNPIDAETFMLVVQRTLEEVLEVDLAHCTRLAKLMGEF